MSGSRNTGCKCDPEMIFELAERSLDTGRARELKRHLDSCPGCRDLYEREVRFNERLGSIEFTEEDRKSVCESVVMALPTRPIKARFVWAVLALCMMAIALFALGAQGADPVAFVMQSVEAFQGIAMLLTDLLGTALAAAGSIALIALAAGAVLDLILVGVLFSVARRRTRAA